MQHLKEFGINGDAGGHHRAIKLLGQFLAAGIHVMERTDGATEDEMSGRIAEYWRFPPTRS